MTRLWALLPRRSNQHPNQVTEEKNLTELGLITRMLIESGAIPFVISTVPQLLLVNETNNFIWGRGKNPWNILRSCGGSSGGEAGLVAAGCSPIGIGSDGGGSVRIPAIYCGLHAFKPTGNRFTMIGHKHPSEYNPRHIQSAVGPLAKNSEDCERLIKALCNEQLMLSEDPLKKFFSWNPESKSDLKKKIEARKLRVGVIKNFNVGINILTNKEMNISGAMDRAMCDFLKNVENAGHQVVSFDKSLPNFSKVIDVFIR